MIYKNLTVKHIGKFLFLWFLIPLNVLAAGVVGNGTPNSCTETALQEKLQGGGDVTFNCGTSPVTIPFTQEKSITLETTIDGNNLITFDGQSKTRLFAVQKNASLTVKNLNLINGFTTDQGGAIWMAFGSVNLTLSNVTVKNNQATRETKICDGGGAIFGDRNTIVIEHSTFIGNKANNGGAINILWSDLRITDSLFQENEAMHTDAMNKLGNCGGGGAVYTDGGKKLKNGGKARLEFIRTKFINNKTNYNAGAIHSYTYEDDNTYVEECYFENNRSLVKGEAGAIGHYRNNSETVGVLYLSNSTFVNNHSDRQGGALYTFNAPMKIVNTTFVGNTAINPDTSLAKDDFKRGIGGAMFLGGGQKIEIINTTVVDNKAGFTSGGINGAGSGKPQPLLKNSIVANNTADNPWGIGQNCGGFLQDSGNNIQFPDGKKYQCIESLAGVDPKLSELANNGGIVPTMALQVGSPAIDTASDTDCPQTDARGTQRPVDGNQDGKAACDAGAFEFGGSISHSGNAKGIDTNTGQSVTTTAEFTPVVETATGQSGNNISVGATDTVTLTVKMKVDSQHVGKQADLVIVAAYIPTGTNTPLWFIRDAQGNWLPWDFNFAHLAAAETKNSLSQNETLPIFKGALGPVFGTYLVYAGYRLQEGVIIYNGGEPVQVVVSSHVH